ncbi:MAG: hypothetical protein AB7P40_29085 [Chloroflexota bacterium]
MSPHQIVSRIVQRAASGLAVSALALSILAGAPASSVLAAPLDAPDGPDIVLGNMDFHSYQSGDRVTSPLLIKNQGNRMARKVEVKILPMGFDNISLSGTGWACRPYYDPADGFFGSVMCTAEEIAPGEVLPLVFKGTKLGEKAILVGEADPRETVQETNGSNNSFRTDS